MATTRGSASHAKSKSKLKGKSSKTPNKSSQKKVPRIQYRSNLQGVITLIKELGLTKTQKQALKDYCPFWELIELVLENKITLASTKKSDRELFNLIVRFNKVKKTFDIGGKSIHLTKEDVAKTFGVRGGKETVVISADKCSDSRFFKNFEGEKRLTTKIVTSALIESVKGEGNVEAENVAQVMTLYLLTALFAPTKGTSLCWGYNKVLSEVSKMNSYDWPGYIYKYLQKSLVMNSSSKVIGCVMLIPYCIMENFPVAEPCSDTAKLLCEKWDLQELMGLGKDGPITQVIESQLANGTLKLNVEVGQCEVGNGNGGDADSGDRKEEYNENGDDVGSQLKGVESGSNGMSDGEILGYKEYLDVERTGKAINLGDESHDWNVLMNSLSADDKNQEQNENVRSKINYNIMMREDNLRLMKENDSLQVEKEEKDSEIRVLKKHIAALIKRKEHYKNLETELREIIMQKDLQISNIEKDLSDVHSTLSITRNENKALRKRLDNQGSLVKDLENDNYKLIDENTELVVQKFTQAVYAGNDATCTGTSFDGLKENVKSQSRHGKLALRKLESDSVVVMNIEAVHTPNEGNQRTQPKKKSPIPFNLEESKTVAVNSMVARLKAKVRKETTKRDSVVYGPEAEGRRTRKRKTPEDESDALALTDTVYAKPISSVPIFDQDFVAGPSTRRILKKLDKNTNRYTKMKHARYVSKVHCDKMAAIEAEFGTGCVVVQFEHRKSGVVFLDSIENLLRGLKMSSLVMNAFAEILMLKYNTQKDPRITIFESTIWSYVKSMKEADDPDAEKRIEHIDKKLEHGQRPSLYILPIITNKGKGYNSEPDHWMLLVHNLEDPKWYLYNSSKGRGSYNPYKDDAFMLKSYMEKKFWYGWRELYRDNLSDPMVAAQDCIEFHTFELEEPACPQQVAGSLDCGVYVCYAMEKVAKGEPVPEKITHNEMLMFKANMVQEFLERFDESRLRQKGRRK